jgi:prophage tail gpP-like protein
MGASHTLDVIVEGQQIKDWAGYHVETSLVTPADTFELRRHFDPDVWNAMRRDAKVTIRIDGTTILTGFIDKREKKAKANTMTFTGRDLTGRLVDESAPAIDYSGMTTEAAIKQLISPWFSKLTTSNARNRILLRGRGKRVAAGNEPVVLINVRTPRAGTTHPGQSRMQIIQEILSRQNLIGYGSPNGEFFIGKPNFSQDAQYLFAHTLPGSTTPCTVRDMTEIEDDGERFSLIMVAGAGGQTDTNYGDNISDNRGVVFDNPFNRIDGTGRDFIHPKRMFMPEKAFESFGDAQRVAENEQLRRDFKRHTISVEAHLHGQFVGTAAATLFATDTIARVVDEEQKPILDDLYLVVSCAFSSDRETGETTTLHLVPRGTEIIL